MFEIFCLIVALIGSSIASFYDLKTTEIPDEIPYSMIAFALVAYALKSLISWNFYPILNSILIGLGFLGFGFLMYYAGQWGGGDAKLLAAIGFLLPDLPKEIYNSITPFPLSYFFNLFLVGAAYMLIYAIVLAFIKRNIVKNFFEDLKASSKIFAFGVPSLFSLFLFLHFLLSLYFKVKFDFMSSVKYSLIPLAFSIIVLIIWKFAKNVEEHGFKQKIPVSKLKVGDVLEESKLWEGLTEREVRKIKRSGRKYVVIKEGVRFAPAFPLALIFSLISGDFILTILNLV